MWHVFRQYLAFRKFGTIAIEHMALVCCVLGAIQIRLLQEHYSFSEFEYPFLKAVVFGLVFQYCMHLRDVYDFRKTYSSAHFFGRLAQALLAATVVLSILYYIFPASSLERSVFVLSLLLGSVFLTLWHVLLRFYFDVRTPRTNLLVIGTGRLAREMVSEILRHPEMGMKVCGFVDDDPSLLNVSVVNPKVVGASADLPKVVNDYGVDQIVVELEDRRGKLPIHELLSMKMRGVGIEEATSLYEKVTGKIALENLKPSWMIFNTGFSASRSMLVHKRILSVVLSSLLLLVFSPVILLIMALIKLDSKGPIFFGQERVGQEDKIFTLWKFRSMRDKAEQESGPVWASANDNRVTRVGKILRRTRLDELPQLWNVLRGDMSLVGPRPERPCFIKELAALIPFYNLRHSVKPGVTGWAQINYRYGSSVRDAVEKLQYDLFYIKHMSWLLDFVIVFETVKTVLVRRGS
ncbi:MAG: TIGR03013 family PEP-CTERM/XrtA system glycosyltransferase [Acidobacteriia bacterium]|nr:TIGR03013 family PEP-CTERM/XrtA system glycosyltransferase [Terriglobia bacterium]